MNNLNNYPYNRSDECSWQPEEAARHLGSLLPQTSSSYLQRNGAIMNNDGHYDPLIRSNDTVGGTDSNSPHTIQSSHPHPNRSNLLTRGRNSIEIRALRHAFGSNTLHGDDVDDNHHDNNQRGSIIHLIKKSCTVIKPIVHAFYDQLKEPLIIMLLVSAAISLFLGNSADAMSIALALSIVSLVAAVQEYRSEKGEYGHYVWFCFVLFISLYLVS